MIGNIIHRTKMVPQQQVQHQDGRINANTDTTGMVAETTDTADISSEHTSASDKLLKEIAGVAVGMLGASDWGMNASLDAAEQNLRPIKGHETLDLMQRLFVRAYGMTAGAAGLFVAGPPGVVLGCMAGCGATGGIIEGVKGALEGVKKGIGHAEKAADKVETKIADKIGKTEHPLLAKIVSKAGKATAFAAIAPLTLPLAVILNSGAESFQYSLRVAGVEPGKIYEGEDAINAGCSTFSTSAGYVGGTAAAANAGANLISQFGAGMAVSGAIASTMAGVDKLVEGFKEGYKEGKEWYENQRNQQRTQ